MNSSNRYLFSNTNKYLGLSNQRFPQPSTLQSIKTLFKILILPLDKNSEAIDMSLNALLNMSCNNIDTIMSNGNKSPISSQMPSRIHQAGSFRKAKSVR